MKNKIQKYCKDSFSNAVRELLLKAKVGEGIIIYNEDWKEMGYKTKLNQFFTRFGKYKGLILQTLTIGKDRVLVFKREENQ